MKLGEISFLDLVPENMRQDRTIKGFACAWDYLMTEMMRCSKYVNLFQNLDMLTDEQLDAVARAISIPWYDTSFSHKKKCDIIEHFENNCFELGSVAAVKRVVEDVFGNAAVLEWFQYGGQPYHFKISVSDQEPEELMDRIARVVRAAKTCKATLDSVETTSTIFNIIYDGDRLVKIITEAAIPAAKEG